MKKLIEILISKIEEYSARIARMELIINALNDMIAQKNELIAALGSEISRLQEANHGNEGPGEVKREETGDQDQAL